MRVVRDPRQRQIYFKKPVPASHAQGTELQLQRRRLKSELDPNDILNPGRVVDQAPTVQTTR